MFYSFVVQYDVKDTLTTTLKDSAIHNLKSYFVFDLLANLIVFVKIGEGANFNKEYHEKIGEIFTRE
jgi:hypothetical protein